MSMPQQPKNMFTRPFADNGNYTAIPDSQASLGRASLQSGFPVETQLPLNQGGIAPNRLDFNGILHMLSAFAFFAQSGGQWTWQNTLDYQSPALVFYNGKMWWCLAANGPGTSSGVKTPGSNSTYWQNLTDFVSQDLDFSKFMMPVGMIANYYGTTAPSGFFPCNGYSFSASSYPKLYAQLGNKSVTPDMRGLFVRGYDPNNARDPNGGSRGFGSMQNDAGINITGTAEGHVIGWYGWNCGGAFYNIGAGGDRGGGGNSAGPNARLGFDASRSWGSDHISSEFRGKNINLLFAIKHD